MSSDTVPEVDWHSIFDRTVFGLARFCRGTVSSVNDLTCEFCGVAYSTEGEHIHQCLDGGAAMRAVLFDEAVESVL